MEIRIRLTSKCNLNCAYCFAATFRSMEYGDMEIPVLEKLLTMAKADGVTRIKLQGGEPTCHDSFVEVAQLIKKTGIDTHLYTNGLYPEEFTDVICESFGAMIVNCNELRDHDLKKIRRNVEKALEHGQSIMLGKTISSVTNDIQSFYEFAASFSESVKIRLDLARPGNGCGESFETFKSMAPNLTTAVITSNFKGLNLELDCCLPQCMFTNAEWKIIRSHLRGLWSRCSTVIDIDPMLNITSCFCGASLSDMNLTNFKSLREAKEFLEELENEMRFSYTSQASCSNCIKHKNRVCQGGCIGHKDADKLRYAGSEALIAYRRGDSISGAFINFNSKYMKGMEESNPNQSDLSFILKDAIEAFPSRALERLISEKLLPSTAMTYATEQLLQNIDFEKENPFMYLYVASRLMKSGCSFEAENLLSRMPQNDAEANLIYNKFLAILAERES